MGLCCFVAYNSGCYFCADNIPDSYAHKEICPFQAFYSG